MIPYKNTLLVGAIVTILITKVVETLFNGTLDLVGCHQGHISYL